MRPSLTADEDHLSAAAEHGRICATAVAGQRRLRKLAATHRALFPEDPFDPALFHTLALASAFFSPWSTAEQLTIANQAGLWVFAVDWQVDYLASSREQVDEVARRCLGVADGIDPEPDDALAVLLGLLLDGLAERPAFPSLRALWREQLRRMLAGMAREWHWQAERTGGANSPGLTLDAYLDNADSVGSAFVSLSHWIATSDPEALRHGTRLLDAGRAVQRVLRLINDIATYEREARWGDVNALVLVPDRAEVTRRLAVLVEECRELLRELETDCPREATYLTRQIGFSSGFYQVADFWGSL